MAMPIARAAMNKGFRKKGIEKCAEMNGSLFGGEQQAIKGLHKPYLGFV
jgi:hypothetical protein